MNKGKCYFCNKEVSVAEGESYKVLKLRHPVSGDIVGPFPVHKKCYKKNKDVRVPLTKKLSTDRVLQEKN